MREGESQFRPPPQLAAGHGCEGGRKSVQAAAAAGGRKYRREGVLVEYRREGVQEGVREGGRYFVPVTLIIKLCTVLRAEEL